MRQQTTLRRVQNESAKCCGLSALAFMEAPYSPEKNHGPVPYRQPVVHPMALPPEKNNRAKSTRQLLRHRRERVDQRRYYCAVFLKVARIDFVERVRRRVMVMKVSARVLKRCERRHALRL